MDEGGANALSKLSGLQQQQKRLLTWGVPAVARTAACAGLVRREKQGLANTPCLRATGPMLLCSLASDRQQRRFLNVQLAAGRMAVDDDSLFGDGFKV